MNSVRFSLFRSPARLCGSFRLALLLAAATLPSAAASAQAPAPQQDRVLSAPAAQARVALDGYVPAWTHRSEDLGELDPATPLRFTLVLSRSSENEQAFQTLLADQQNPHSPLFHQWLTPQAIGSRFGPTAHDLAALTAWLAENGMPALEVAPSGVFVTAEAPVGVVARAFSTSFHRFRPHAASAGSAATAAPGSAGTAPFAITSAPLLPAALQPLVRSIVGFSEVPARPSLHSRVVPIAPGSGSLSARVARAGSASPRVSYDLADHYLGPGDFNLIYGVTPALTSGIMGTGIKVAVLSLSRVLPADLNAFETLFGLSTGLPSVVVPPTGADPGLTNDGRQEEATLDVSRVLGTAPGTAIDLVATTPSAGGLRGVAQYEVQTLRDPVMTLSYHQCEADAGASGVSFWDSLFAQAAAEGISAFVASGDSGAADCAFSDPTVPQALSINAFCSSSYVTCVGGTEFADQANPAHYWGTDGSNYVSATGYIPEGAWNEPSYVNSSGVTVYAAAATGGGVSTQIPKPSWQTGPGIPQDGFRDIPDVSFSSSGHDAYIGCLATAGGDCSTSVLLFSGTSAAAPSMAGIAALLNQKLGGSQGNLNPLLYRLFLNTANNPDATNTFQDVTPASSTVVLCTPAIPSMCNNSNPAVTALAGGLAGYPLTVGYDLATGLGSLNANELLVAAAAPPSSPVPYPSSSSLTSVPGVALPIVTLNNAQNITFLDYLTVSGSTNTAGTVQFLVNGAPYGGPVTVSNGQTLASSVAQTFSPGTYRVTAVYSGNSTVAASTSGTLTLTIVPAPTATTATTFQISSPTVAADHMVSITFSVTSTATSTLIPSGFVEFAKNGVPFADYALNDGVPGPPQVSASQLGGVGSFAITATYLGDANFLPSTSASQPFAVTKGLVSVTLSPLLPAEVATPETYTVGFSYDLLLPSPTGTVEFFIDGSSIGSAPVQSRQASLTSYPAPSTAGSHTITAAYSGDANWLPAIVSPISFTTTDGVPYAVSAQTGVTLNAGESVLNKLPIVVTRLTDFAANINLACTVAFNGTGPVTAAPTCEFAGNFFQEQGTSTLLINTTAPHATTAKLFIPAAPHHSGGTPLAAGSALLCTLVCLLRRPRRSSLLWSGGALLCLLLIVGCGGGGAGSGGSGSGNGGGGSGGSGGGTTVLVGGTTPGSYTVTVSSTNTAGVPDPPPLNISLTVQ